MKILAIAVCLTVIQLSYAATPDYTVECTSTTAATVTVKKDYTLTSTDGTCTLTNDNPLIYKLDKTCLPNKKLTLEHKTVKDGKVLTDVVQELHVECVEGVDGVTEKVDSDQISLLKSTAAPKTETGFIRPKNPSLSLLLIKTQPTNNPAALTLTGATSATLGETFYLTILDTTTTDALIIPQACTAMEADKTNPTLLWDITKPQCIQESDVVKSVFTSGATSDSTPQHFTYVAIQAFKFTDNEDAKIIFECDVRVCTKDTAGLCKSEKAALGTCATPAPPVNRRRRREVDDAATSHGRVHHVTATLRVVNDVMAHGIGGSTTVSYTVPCLLMSLLAKIIL